MKFLKICNLLLESPPYVELHSPARTYNFTNSAYMRYNVDKDKLKLDNTINIDGLNIKCYIREMGSNINLYFLAEDDKLIAVYELNYNKNLYFDRFAWQDIKYKGILRQIFFKYILPKYKMICSDSIFSQYGKEFWHKNLIYGFKKGYNVGYMTNDKNLHQFESIKDIEDGYDALFSTKISDKQTGIILYIKID